MKKIFYIAAIAAAAIVAACGGKENNSDADIELWQDYTSFVISNQKTEDTLYRVVSGYFDAAGYCWKIAEYGTLAPDSTTTETILDIDVDSIYIFYDSDKLYVGTGLYIRRFGHFIARKNRKTDFVVTDTTYAEYLPIVTDADSMLYPNFIQVI